jgi:hypothetical protein
VLDLLTARTQPAALPPHTGKWCRVQAGGAAAQRDVGGVAFAGYPMLLVRPTCARHTRRPALNDAMPVTNLPNPLPRRIMAVLAEMSVPLL